MKEGGRGQEGRASACYEFELGCRVGKIRAVAASLEVPLVEQVVDAAWWVEVVVVGDAVWSLVVGWCLPWIQKLIEEADSQ